MNLHKLLSEFNWYYTMTDDPRRYDEGLAQEKKIFEYLKLHGLDETLDYLDKLKEMLTLLYNSNNH